MSWNKDITNSIIKGINSSLGSPTKTILIRNNPSLIAILVYENKEDLVIIREKSNLVIKFSTIITYNVDDKTEVSTSSYSGPALSTTNTNMGSMIGRSVAGGIIAGGVGSIIGGATAKKTTTTDFGSSYSTSTTTHDYSVIININSISTPTFTLNFQNDSEAFNSFIAILNIILQSYPNKVKAVGDNAPHKIGDSYSSKKDALDRKLKEEAKARKEIRQQKEQQLLQDKDEELDFIERHPISILKNFFTIKDFLPILSVPLSIIAFSITWQNDWWMFFSYLLTIFVFGICLLPPFGFDENIKSGEKSSYNFGIVGASSLLSIPVAILPFITMSSSGCDFLEKITGYFYWHKYEGGFIVTLLVLATILGLIACFIGTLESSNLKNEIWKTSSLQKKINKRTYIWGVITTIIIEAIIIVSLILCSSHSKKNNDYNYMYQVPLNEEPTETYHNKYDGTEQNEYKNSKEQEQDLKDIDDIIKEEEKNGVYDDNPN